jgi:hypothetical protein
VSISSLATKNREETRPQNNKKLSDAECQPIIAAQSDDFNPDFFYNNQSGLPLADVQEHFCSLLPGVGVHDKDMVLCGYKDNRSMLPVHQAVRTRKINLRQIPWRPNTDVDENGDKIGGWVKSQPKLPPFMAFDVDENDKPDFHRVWGTDYRCYEIHDALDIPRPLFTTVSHISWNCQFVYQIWWTEDDLQNEEAAFVEYERVRKELTELFGADPKFRNHVVRSPMYIAGHHRKNPNRTTSTKEIDLDTETLWHFSTWYDPRGYTLAELRELAVYLRELNGQAPKAVLVPVPETSPVDVEENHPNGNSIPLERQLELERRDPSSIVVGERDDYLFSCAAIRCRRVAGRFRFKDGAFDNFMSWAVPQIKALNRLISVPLEDNVVTEKCKSVVKYCLSSRYRPLGLSSEEARYIANLRYGPDYVTVQDKADEAGVSKRTYYRQQESIYLIIDRQCAIKCDICGNEFQSKRKDARTCSPKCRKVLSRQKKTAPEAPQCPTAETVTTVAPIEFLEPATAPKPMVTSSLRSLRDRMRRISPNGRNDPDPSSKG